MMKQQRGEVSVILIVLGAILGVILILAAICGESYVSAYNLGNTDEQNLIATQQDNKNILAQYGQKVLESTQVPEMYKNDLVELTKAAIAGRYGPDGSKASMQWLHEQNPNLDPAVYKQLQQIIEAGRDNFENGQRKQIDQLRQYQTALGSFWGGMWLRMAGYPKHDLKDFAIVSTDRADTAFKNHREDGPIQLRAK